MAGVIKKVLKASLVALIVPVVAFAVQQKNPRGSVSNVRDNAYSQESLDNAKIRRSATSVIARNVSANNRKKRTVVTARPATVQVAKTRSARSVVNNSVKSRAAMKSGMARSAVAGAKKVSGGISRAETARATAVFNDVTKIGGGYSNCRDASRRETAKLNSKIDERCSGSELTASRHHREARPSCTASPERFYAHHASCCAVHRTPSRTLPTGVPTAA